MPIGVRELHDLVFDRRAVARAPRRDRTAVHRRLRDVPRDQCLALRAEKGDPAWQLRRMSRGAIGRARSRPEVRP